MKYIIKESQINKLVGKFLNSKDFKVWDVGDGEFNVADGEFGRDVFRYSLSYTYPSSYQREHSLQEVETVYISDILISQIMKLFNLSPSDAIAAFADWFNKTYDKNLSPDDFTWMDDISTDDEDED